MDRRTFLKKFGIGAAAVISSPAWLANQALEQDPVDINDPIDDDLVWENNGYFTTLSVERVEW